MNFAHQNKFSNFHFLLSVTLNFLGFFKNKSKVSIHIVSIFNPSFFFKVFLHHLFFFRKNYLLHIFWESFYSSISFDVLFLTVKKRKISLEYIWNKWEKTEGKLGKMRIFLLKWGKIRRNFSYAQDFFPIYEKFSWFSPFFPALTTVSAVQSVEE